MERMSVWLWISIVVTWVGQGGIEKEYGKIRYTAVWHWEKHT